MGEPTAKILDDRVAAPARSTGSIAPDGTARAERPAKAGRGRPVPWARRPRRPRLWFEILLIAVSYWVYSLVRNAVPEQEGAAMTHARELWRLEHVLGIAVEEHINHAADSVTWLIVGMNYYYATLHFIMTIAVLVWLFRRHPGRYASARLTIFATTAFALFGFYFFPLAPPRLMHAGFVDTVAVHHTWGSMASGDLDEAQAAAVNHLRITLRDYATTALRLEHRALVRDLLPLTPRDPKVVDYLKRAIPKFAGAKFADRSRLALDLAQAIENDRDEKVPALVERLEEYAKAAEAEQKLRVRSIELKK